MIRLAVASLALSLALVQIVTAYAQSETELRAEKLVKNWQAWAKKHGIERTSIAMSYDGKLVAQFGIGMEPTDAAPIASVSKSITGICVAKLVEAGKLSFETPLKDVFPELDSAATVSSLLKQTSGYTHDITQKPAKYKGYDREYLEWVSRKEIERGRDQAKVGSYHYNNANYAMLGAAIRKVTGKSYEDACKEIVFDPIGVTDARLNPDWRIMSAWGGWKLSAVDNLKFVDAYFDRRNVLGIPPYAFPYHKFEGGRNYGMGYNFRTGRRGGNNFWHNGRWHSDRDGKKTPFRCLFCQFRQWMVGDSQLLHFGDQ